MIRFLISVFNYSGERYLLFKELAEEIMNSLSHRFTEAGLAKGGEDLVKEKISKFVSERAQSFFSERYYQILNLLTHRIKVWEISLYLPPSFHYVADNLQ